MIWAAWVGAAFAGSDARIVFTGIDYGLVRLVGTQDFREPQEIFPGYFEKWNALFVEEILDDLGKRAKAEAVSDFSHLAALHAATDPQAQILRDDSFPFEDSLPESTIRERVASYTLRETQGRAFTLIADQLNKPNQLGCFWAVTYDIATRDVTRAVRSCEPAHGIGFRNYWFGAVKDTVANLPKRLE